MLHWVADTNWRNLGAVISKAKTACETSGHAILDHFVDVNKMVTFGSGSQREVDDITLTRSIRGCCPYYSSTPTSCLLPEPAAPLESFSLPAALAPQKKSPSIEGLFF